MLGNFLIGLREGLEASLIVSILVAYLVKIDRRDVLPRVWLGVVAAVVLSVGFAGALTLTSQNLSFEAQEAFGGFLSIIAVVLVTWMIFWMASAARGIKGELEGKMSQALDRTGWAMALVGFLAVGREGLETALFLWTAGQGNTSGAVPLIGALLGLGLAAFLGYLIYRGALKLNLSTFFKWTGIALIIIAAGVLAYGVHDLQEAGILPGLNNLAFDVSGAIPPGSWYGTLLKGTINFSPATTVLEFVVWIGYLVPTMYLFLRKLNRGKAPVSPQKSHIDLKETPAATPQS